MIEIKKYDRYLKDYATHYIQQAQNEMDRVMLELKLRHTKYVKENMIQIAASCHLNEEDMALAELIALFHDIGRFRQFALYHTYDDKKSVNHAKYSVDVLKDQSALQDLTKEEQEIVYGAIYYHNVHVLSEYEMSDRTRYFAKMIRDADRLDIYRDMAEDVPNMTPEEQYVWYNERDLQATDISDVIFKDIMKKESPSMKDCKTVSESKFARMSWVFYDMSFKEAIRIILQANYFEKIYATITPNERVEKMYTFIREQMKLSLEDPNTHLIG